MPCYNEAKTIDEVVAAVLASPLTGELLIVDDGSTDGTRDILATLDDPRVRVLLQDREPGQGRGASAAASPRRRLPFVIVQDADLEYDPAEYRELLAAAPRRARPTSSTARASSAAARTASSTSGTPSATRS